MLGIDHKLPEETPDGQFPRNPSIKRAVDAGTSGSIEAIGIVGGDINVEQSITLGRADGYPAERWGSLADMWKKGEIGGRDGWSRFKHKFAQTLLLVALRHSLRVLSR